MHAPAEMPPLVTARPVVARIWAADDELRTHAVEHLTLGSWLGRWCFDVTEIRHRWGLMCPLERRGPGVLMYQAWYGWAWQLQDLSRRSVSRSVRRRIRTAKVFDRKPAGDRALAVRVQACSDWAAGRGLLVDDEFVACGGSAVMDEPTELVDAVRACIRENSALVIARRDVLTAGVLKSTSGVLGDLPLLVASDEH